MIRRYFQLDELGTNVKQEILAGITTFVTMAYIIVVNPKILEAAGMPFGPSMVATILSAFFGTLAMGLYARRPFAIAPYMGENAFVAFTVVKVLGYTWQLAGRRHSPIVENCLCGGNRAVPHIHWLERNGHCGGRCARRAGAGRKSFGSRCSPGHFWIFAHWFSHD